MGVGLCDTVDESDISRVQVPLYSVYSLSTSKQAEPMMSITGEKCTYMY